MSLSQALGEGLMVTGVGLLIVFAVLIILMLVMILMKKVFYKEPSKTQAVQAESQNGKKSEASAANAAPSADGSAQDPNLIAVLTAAVAVCMNTPTHNLKIKSYRRVDNNAPVWNRAGLNEAINSRF